MIGEQAWGGKVEAFSTAFHPDRCLLVGGDGIPVVDFISKPARNWILG